MDEKTLRSLIEAGSVIEVLLLIGAVILENKMATRRPPIYVLNVPETAVISNQPAYDRNATSDILGEEENGDHSVLSTS
jgi:hypothetical protein